MCEEYGVTSEGQKICCRCTHVRYNDTCLATCPAGTFLESIISHMDPQANCTYHTTHISTLQIDVCAHCDAACLTCTGPSLHNCTSCNESHYRMKEETSESTFSCVKSCGFGFFANVSSSSCIKCSDKFLNCSHCSPDKCIKCEENMYVQDGMCVEICSAGFISNSDTCYIKEDAEEAKRKALVPARNTNTGAQKCVIHLVKKNATDVCVGSSGANAVMAMKALTWSSAIMIITRPRSRSTD